MNTQEQPQQQTPQERAQAIRLAPSQQTQQSYNTLIQSQSGVSHQLLSMNNSNPFLMSPSAPSIKQNVQANQPVITVDTIETTVPGATVFVGAPINVVNITVNGIPPSTDRISTGFTSVTCNPLSIVSVINLAETMRNTLGTTTLSNADNTYTVNLYGQISLTTGLNTTARAEVGHVAIDVSSSSYFLGVYGASDAGGNNPSAVTTDSITFLNPTIDPYTNVTFLVNGVPNPLGTPGTNIGTTKLIINNNAAAIAVTGSTPGLFFYSGASYNTITFTVRGSSAVLNYNGTKWVVVVPNLPAVTLS